MWHYLQDLTCGHTALGGNVPTVMCWFKEFDAWGLHFYLGFTFMLKKFVLTSTRYSETNMSTQRHLLCIDPLLVGRSHSDDLHRGF